MCSIGHKRYFIDTFFYFNVFRRNFRHVRFLAFDVVNQNVPGEKTRALISKWYFPMIILNISRL